jgi:hypothetical protein
MVTLCSYADLNAHVADSTSSPGRWVSLSSAVKIFIINAYLEVLQTCIFKHLMLLLDCAYAKRVTVVRVYSICLCACVCVCVYIHIKICIYIYIYTHIARPLFCYFPPLGHT